MFAVLTEVVEDDFEVAFIFLLVGDGHGEE
jgi:hypothetical protein